MPVKPYKWSTSVEDVTSSDVGNNSEVDEIEFSDGLTSETESSGFKRVKHKRTVVMEDGEGVPEKKPYRSKLSRKYSVKVKKEEKESF